MKFSVPRHRNPFDNPLLAFVVHVVALGIACAAGYFALLEVSWMPLVVGFGLIGLMEATWLYFRLRR